MPRAVSEALRVAFGIAFLGALAAGALDVLGIPVGLGELVAILAIDASFAAMAAILLPLRHAASALLAAGLVGAVGLLGFFGAHLYFRADALSADALLVLLGLAPLVAGGMSALGSSYLARELRNARRSRAVVLGR